MMGRIDGMNTQILHITAPDGATRLGLREKRDRSRDAASAPVLLLHGATFGSALFDLPRQGYSLMEALTGTGRAVYALDIGGYGLSRGNGVMDAPPEAHPPFAGADQAQRDIEAAVTFILDRCGVPALDLVGFSWGTILAARYAGNNKEQVRRLALYAPLYAERNPLWLGRLADPRDPGRLAPVFCGAWRLVTASSLVERWSGDLPNGDPLHFRERDVPELVFDALAALDPQAALQSPRAFRCPNGAMADMLRVFNGEPLYDPAKLTMKLLAIRGCHDTTSTATDMARLLDLAPSPDKQARTIEPGSHFLCLEKNRASLYRELDRFLGPAQ